MPWWYAGCWRVLPISFFFFLVLEFCFWRWLTWKILQVEKIFKDEATEEKGERARLVCYCFFPGRVFVLFSMDADVCINVFEKLVMKLFVWSEVLFSLLCCYCYHAIRISVNNSWIETMANLALLFCFFFFFLSTWVMFLFLFFFLFF